MQFHPDLSKLHRGPPVPASVVFPHLRTGCSRLDHGARAPVLPRRLCTFRDQLCVQFVIPYTALAVATLHGPHAEQSDDTQPVRGAGVRLALALRYPEGNGRVAELGATAPGHVEAHG